MIEPVPPEDVPTGGIPGAAAQLPVQQMVDYLGELIWLGVAEMTRGRAAETPIIDQLPLLRSLVRSNHRVASAFRGVELAVIDALVPYLKTMTETAGLRLSDGYDYLSMSSGLVAMYSEHLLSHPESEDLIDITPPGLSAKFSEHILDCTQPA